MAISVTARTGFTKMSGAAPGGKIEAKRRGLAVSDCDWRRGGAHGSG